MKRYFMIMVLLTSVFPTFSQFVERSKEIGIDHIHKNVLLMGGGGAFFDLNNDGFLDLYVTGGGETDKLYLNLGNGSFFDISEQSNIRSITQGKMTSAVIHGDIDNDGYSDLFVTTSDNSPNILLKNNGDGSFEDIANTKGMDAEINSFGATFLDVDQDGLLDIYVVNYIKVSSFSYDENNDVIGFEHECHPNQLYINDGAGNYIESAENYGVDNVGCGLAVAATDMNNDGYVDLFVANDFGAWIEPNAVYLNNFPEKKFLDRSAEMNLNAGLYAMGIAIGDYDDNQLEDFYITNIGRNSLHVANISGNYQDLAEEANVDNTLISNDQNATSWGTFFFDYDNDTDLDLFVANGFIGTASFLNTGQQDPNKLYENDGQGSFVDISDAANISSTFFNRGAIYGDYDNDGDLDVFCATVDGDNDGQQHALFYENRTQAKGNWIEIKLEGLTVNKDAYGARVFLYEGNNTYMRTIYGSGSYSSQSANVLHFGVGLIETNVDSIVVNWGVDNHQTFYNLPINQKILIQESSSTFDILGCMDSNNTNYNELATISIGCLNSALVGCTDAMASNFESGASFDDGNCEYEILTNLGENGANNDIVVFPNAFSNSLKLEFYQNKAELRIMLIDVQGRIVYQEAHIGTGSLEIDSSGFSEGIYLLKILDTKSRKSILQSKLIKTQ